MTPDLRMINIGSVSGVKLLFLH